MIKQWTIFLVWKCLAGSSGCLSSLCLCLQKKQATYRYLLFLHTCWYSGCLPAFLTPKSTLWTLVTFQTTLLSFSNLTKFLCHMACMVNSPNPDTIPQLMRNSKPNLKQKLWGSLRSISKVDIPLSVSSVWPDRRQLASERQEKKEYICVLHHFRSRESYHRLRYSRWSARESKLWYLHT